MTRKQHRKKFEASSEKLSTLWKVNPRTFLSHDVVAKKTTAKSQWMNTLTQTYQPT
jgi:hypothetical protein